MAGDRLAGRRWRPDDPCPGSRLLVLLLQEGPEIHTGRSRGSVEK